MYIYCRWEFVGNFFQQVPTKNVLAVKVALEGVRICIYSEFGRPIRIFGSRRASGPAPFTDQEARSFAFNIKTHVGYFL